MATNESCSRTPHCTTVERVTKLLKDTTLHDLIGPQTVVIFKDTCTVDQALKTLASKRILSAPVVSTDNVESKGCGCLGPLFAPVPPGSHWPQEKGLAGNHQILGFLDVRDVLTSFLAELEASGFKKMKMLQRMRLLEEKGQTYAFEAIKNLKVFGGDGDFLHIAEAAETSLHEVVVNGLLNAKERGTHNGKHIVTGTVHRVALYDSHFRLTNIVSQTDIVKFLYMNKQELGELANKTAADLGWANKPVVSLEPDVAAIEAMMLMNARQISAVAVVDGVGKIIGNFSVSEMRTIMAEHFGALALPVGEFLALEHGTEFHGYSHIHEQEVVESKGHKFITDRTARTRPRTPGEEVGQALVLVTPKTTFSEILEKIVQNRIHRVYVVDDDEKPVGVVTCTDIVRLVVKITQYQLKLPHLNAAEQQAAAEAKQQLQQQASVEVEQIHVEESPKQ